MTELRTRPLAADRGLDDAVAALATTLRSAHDRRWPRTHRIDVVCDEALWPAGKLLRPALVLLSCAAVGGCPDDAVPVALAVEYLHVASLVHDDIVDGAQTRRGRPSTAAGHGAHVALLAGDHLVFQVFAAAAEAVQSKVSAERTLAVLSELAATGARLCRGQDLEHRAQRSCGATLVDYCAVARDKTSALLAVGCRAGGIVGGAAPHQLSVLTAFAERLGVVFQMIDDLRPYLRRTGEQAVRADKDRLVDLENRIATFPMVIAGELGGSGVAAALEAIRRAPAEHAFPLLEALVHTPEMATRLYAEIGGQVTRAVSALAPLDRGPARDHLVGIARALLRDVAYLADHPA